MVLDTTQVKIFQAEKGENTNNLSYKAGISNTTLTRLLQGKQTARPVTIGKLAKALGVPVSAIIIRED